MNLLDSNIVIAAALQNHEAIDRMVRESPCFYSVVMCIEVLGFHRLTPADQTDLTTILAGGQELSLDEVSAVKFRQERRMSLVDAIIAATALAHGLPRVTRNTGDFYHITGLRLINPFKS